MSSRVVCYGFVGRGPASVRALRYVSSEAERLRLRQLFAFPDDASKGEMLMSLRTRTRLGEPWFEALETPQLLSRYLPLRQDPEVVLQAVVPTSLRRAPGGFDVFRGETPLGGHPLQNHPDIEAQLWKLPAGSFSIGWTGHLRGLLLVGHEVE